MIEKNVYSALTPKQRMLLDYMRGNGCVLTPEGAWHLVASGRFRKPGLSQVLARMVATGYIDRAASLAPGPHYVLTQKGRRA